MKSFKRYNYGTSDLVNKYSEGIDKNVVLNNEITNIYKKINQISQTTTPTIATTTFASSGLSGGSGSSVNSYNIPISSTIELTSSNYFIISKQFGDIVTFSRVPVQFSSIGSIVVSVIPTNGTTKYTEWTETISGGASVVTGNFLEVGIKFTGNKIDIMIYEKSSIATIQQINYVGSTSLDANAQTAYSNGTLAIIFDMVINATI